MATTVASVEEVQQAWHELILRVGQLEAEKGALEQEVKALRLLLERAVEHRKKTHGELVLLLTSLVSKLPLNDVGVIVSRLVEHNTHVSQYLAAIAKGAAEADLPRPTMLKTLDDTKHELAAALKPLVEELLTSDTPLEAEMLRSFLTEPDAFFTPRVARANRCFIKGQLPRERVLREFGQDALVFFQDMTTDPKLNPRPKPEEVVLAFRPDFETVFQQQPNLLPGKRDALLALHKAVQRSKTPTTEARTQRQTFNRLSFLIELLYFYEHQSTEAPEVIFAQRLPALLEQLVLSGPHDKLEENLLLEAERLLAHIISPDHRLMVINNLGKTGDTAKTLKFLLRLRAEKTAAAADEVIAEFLKHVISPPPQKPPSAAEIAGLLRLLPADRHRQVTRAVMFTDRIRPDDAESLARAVGAELGLQGVEQAAQTAPHLPPELERQVVWARIKDQIANRTDAPTIATAIRERLNAKYDAEEIRQSWMTLIEADSLSFIRIFCHLPYLPSGKTDPIARTVLDVYVSRLLHEKYAATLHKVVNSLKSMHKAKPDSPTLQTFIGLVRWVNPEAADKLSADIGMHPAVA